MCGKAGQLGIGERHITRSGHGLDAGQSAQAGEQALQVGCGHNRFRSARPPGAEQNGHLHLHADAPMRLKSGVGRNQTGKAVHQQAGADDQQRGQGDLGSDQQMGSTAGTAASLHPTPQSPTDAAQRRHQGDPQQRAQREQRDKSHHHRIEPARAQHLQRRPQGCGQQLQARSGEQAQAGNGGHPTQNPAQQGQKAALRQKLLQQAPARTAERQAQGQFRLPLTAARQQQVGDVHTCEQQEAAHACHQQPQRLLPTAGQHFAQGHGSQYPGVSGAGVIFLDGILARQRGELCLHPGNADGRRWPSR